MGECKTADLFDPGVQSRVLRSYKKVRRIEVIYQGRTKNVSSGRAGVYSGKKIMAGKEFLRGRGEGFGENMDR